MAVPLANVPSVNGSPAPHHVVIVGGGFAGLNAARYLRRAPVEVTLVDRRNFHLFQPLLYQVASGELSPANIAAPLRSVLEAQKNCEVLMGEVTGFDVAARRVILDCSTVPYDTLIVAAGARHSYFGHPEWESHAPGLKTIEDATEIRRRLFSAFELAEREADHTRRPELLNFVIVGGGPTGVELAGALADIAQYALKHEFRHINPADAHIVLVEAGDRVLNAFPPELSMKAQAELEKLNVKVRLKTMVTAIEADHVMLNAGGATERLSTRTVIWAAGVAASPLAKNLADATGAMLDRAGRISVEPDLSLPGHPEIFVLGDMANYTHDGGKAATRRGPGGDSRRPVRGEADSGQAPRWCAAEVSLPRAGKSRHHRPQRRGRRLRPRAVKRLRGLGAVAVHPPDEHRQLSQPHPRVLAMGLELSHARPLGAPDHRRRSQALVGGTRELPRAGARYG